MKQITLLIVSFLTLACTSPTEIPKNVHLTVSSLIDKENSTNSLIISALHRFLQSKNNSLSDNDLWLKSDFQNYVYPYLDIYNIEHSTFGKDFYKPTVMEILPTENENQNIVKIAFIGHNSKTNENLIKSIYNIVANVENENITFSRYLDFVTKDWTTQKNESINYMISPNKTVNYTEISHQKEEINKLCQFFQTQPINITYYSCVNPKELFEIKGFDYHPMMYADKSGGLAELGNMIFSGNNSEVYTHEIVHIYTNNLFPKIDQYINEGIATYIAGSGKHSYHWHRNKLRQFLAEHKNYNIAKHTDPYERIYFENETSIPYLTAALILERTFSIYGKDKLMEVLKSDKELWPTLKTVGLTKANINNELRKQIKRPPTSLWE